MKIFKKIILILALVIISFAIIFMANGFIEKASIDNSIKEFKSRGELVKTEGNTTYYKVASKDIEDGSMVFDPESGDNYIGTVGDIILTNRNPLRYSRTIIIKNLVGFFARTMFLGHASYDVSENGNMIVEITDHTNENGSMSIDTDGVKYHINDWIDADDGSPLMIGLRVKGVGLETKDQLKRFAYENIGKPYNMTFIRRKNSFYCTDLVSRAYESAQIKLNYDGFFVTGNDLIVSGQTYIIFVRERIEIDGEEHFNIYYLVEE